MWAALVRGRSGQASAQLYKQAVPLLPLVASAVMQPQNHGRCLSLLGETSQLARLKELTELRSIFFRPQAFEIGRKHNVSAESLVVTW